MRRDGIGSSAVSPDPVTISAAPGASGDDLALTGPGTLAGRYLRSFWQPVYHSSDLAPGQAKPLNILGETFTIYRGEGGAVHLVDPFCPHRGLRLSAGHIEGDALRCLYHAWKFEHDGRCVEQPAEDAPFFEHIRIRSYPVREYLGFVFAYLGEGVPPEFPRHPEFEHFDGMLEIDSYQRNCNYFQNIDNALDHCHLQFVHGDVAKKALDTVVMGRTNRIEDSEWGLTLTSPRQDGQAFISQFGMPNMLTVAALPIDADMGWKESLFWWVPIDDRRHMQFGINTVRATGEAAERIYQKRQARRRAVDQPHQWLAEEILAGRARLEDADGERCDLVKLQDNVAQVGQMRIVDRRIEHLGASDIGVVKLRRLWRRELQAFAEGRALQAWKKTPQIRPSVWGFGATPVDPGSGAKPRIVDVRPFVEVDLQLRTLSQPLP
jgi:5,5'-dehydrodivanillate O-demethylase oxygenase subunit